MRRGEIWVGNLNPNRGAEAGKIRPVLIMQADALTGTGTPTIVVIPMSTHPYDGNPLHISISARDRLRKNSIILTEQPRTLDHDRFGEGPLTRLRPDEMLAVEKALLAVLGMY